MVFVVPEVRVMVEAVVDHFVTVIPVVKGASVSPRRAVFAQRLLSPILMPAVLTPTVPNCKELLVWENSVS